MKKRTLTEMRDLWVWQESEGITEASAVPEAEDVPKHIPCDVVWGKEEDGKIHYLFVYVTDIFNLV